MRQSKIQIRALPYLFFVIPNLFRNLAHVALDSVLLFNLANFAAFARP